mgnify:CR=1 FL=1
MYIYRLFDIGDLNPGQQVDFSARAVDSFGNAYALEGVTVAWHCWPATLGAIDPWTGLFTGGAAGGDGCVVAVVSRVLRFGDADVATATGTGRITVQGARPNQFALHPNSPNPFNAQTVIRFDLPEDRPVRLELYDSAGRLARVLVDGPQPAGSHAVTWDGLDADGTAVASGVYFARLQAGSFVAVRKALLVR